MALPQDFITALTCPHPKLVLERLLKGPKGRGKALWTWTAELRPADTYCYLRAKFGLPNGPQNFLRSDDSGNLIHWDWVLDHPMGSLHILGMNFRTEIWVSGELEVTDTDSQVLAELFKADFASYGPKMAEVRQALEKWTEFVNPYARLRRAIEKLLTELEDLDLRPETQRIPDIKTANDIKAHDWEEVLGRYSKGLGLCFGIRSMLPIMAEAYVNFVLFALMKPDLKADERLRENALRQPIDVRIKSLHMTCGGFAKPVDYASQECKAYHGLVNERNDLLHGNVVLEKLRFNQVYFDGNIPIFETYRSMWERSVGVEIEAVGLQRLSSEVKIVNAFIEYLTTCMRPEVKKQIDLMAEKRDLGWNRQTGRIGILFPDHLVDMHLDLSKSASRKSGKSGVDHD